MSWCLCSVYTGSSQTLQSDCPPEADADACREICKSEWRGEAWRLKWRDFCLKNSDFYLHMQPKSCKECDNVSTGTGNHFVVIPGLSWTRGSCTFVRGVSWCWVWRDGRLWGVHLCWLETAKRQRRCWGVKYVKSADGGGVNQQQIRSAASYWSLLHAQMSTQSLLLR